MTKPGRVLATLTGILASLSGLTVLPASGEPRADDLLAIERVCDTGVAPAAARHHAELLAVLAREGRQTDLRLASAAIPAGTHAQVVRTTSGTHGPTRDFWGPRAPEHALAECVQPR
jgi:hypothetical protein